MLGITPLINLLKTLLFGACILCVATPSLAECSPNAIQLRWDGGSARFNVELADTPQTRARGLMFRESMPRYSGMLFIYDRPQRASFWMRNTLIPLDMLFFDAAGQLVNLHHNAKPLDETSINGGDQILYVLEINGGLSKRLRIGLDVQMRHPRIDQTIAHWTCAS